jgi:hypothetical protein
MWGSAIHRRDEFTRVLNGELCEKLERTVNLS